MYTLQNSQRHALCSGNSNPCINSIDCTRNALMILFVLEELEGWTGWISVLEMCFCMPEAGSPEKCDHLDEQRTQTYLSTLQIVCPDKRGHTPLQNIPLKQLGRRQAIG